MKPNFNPSQGMKSHYFVTGIDGLRTLAVLGVIICDANFNDSVYYIICARITP